MFDARNHIKAVHGAPDARTVTASAGQPERITTSRELDARLRHDHPFQVTRPGYWTHVDPGSATIENNG